MSGSETALKKEILIYCFIICCCAGWKCAMVYGWSLLYQEKTVHGTFTLRATTNSAQPLLLPMSKIPSSTQRVQGKFEWKLLLIYNMHWQIEIDNDWIWCQSSVSYRLSGQMFGSNFNGYFQNFGLNFVSMFTLYCMTKLDMIDTVIVSFVMLMMPNIIVHTALFSIC